MTISGCEKKTVIISVGYCERGIVTQKQLAEVRKIFPEAQATDVLISGGCYQDKFIKKLEK